MFIKIGAFLILLIISAHFIWLIYKFYYFKFKGAPLVFSLLPWFSHNHKYSKNCLDYLRACQKKYGDNFSLFLGNRFVTVITNPLDYKEFHNLNTKGFIDNETAFKEIGLNLTGAKQTFAQLSLFDRDKVYIEEFSNKNFAQNYAALKTSYQAYIDEYYEKKYNDKINKTNKLQLFDFIEEFLFFVGTNTLIEKDFIRHKAVLDSYRTIERNFPIIVSGCPVKFIPSLWGALKNIKTVSYNILKYKRFRPFMGKLYNFDKLKYNTDFNEEAGMNIGTLWAALTTTTAAGFWLVYYVFQDPDLCQRIKTEIKTEFQLKNLTDFFNADQNFEQFQNLKLLNSCVEEILRLTSNTLSYRRASKDFVCELPAGGKLKLKQNDYVSILPMVMHHDPEIFEQPDKFIATRFMDNPKFYYKNTELPMPTMPFGGGRGICPGRRLANRELKMMIIIFLIYFELIIPLETKNPGFNYARAGLGIFPPKSDVDFFIRKLQI